MALPIKTGQLFIILALIMAVISAVVIKSLLGAGAGNDKPVVEEPKTKKIVVAALPISAGTTIASSDISVVEWPKDYVPKGSVFYERDKEDLIGRVVKSNIFASEPILKPMLADDLSRGGLPVVIPEGMRAVSVGVTETIGVAGFVKPGDHVDVLVTYKEPSGPEGEKVQVTRTVIQNALVLAAAQVMDDTVLDVVKTPKALRDSDEEDDDKADEDKADSNDKKDSGLLGKKKKDRKRGRGKNTDGNLVSSVTLAVFPEEAQSVTFAEEYGDIRLSLRGEGDADIVNLPAVNNTNLHRESGGLIDQMIEELPVPEASVGTIVEFYSGTQKEELNF